MCVASPSGVSTHDVHGEVLIQIAGFLLWKHMVMTFGRGWGSKGQNIEDHRETGFMDVPNDSMDLS